MSQTPFPNMIRSTYRRQPQNDFLQISQARNLFPPHAVWYAPDQGMEGPQCPFPQDGGDDVFLDLFAGVGA